MTTLDQNAERVAEKSSKPSDGIPLPENKIVYPALDGFRAVAVILVFVQHYRDPNSFALSWGWAGVDLFFVLSGFLITGILYDTRNSNRSFRNFYGRRTLRIFPLYYAVLLAGLLLTPIVHWVKHPSWILWPFYLENYARFLYYSDFLRSGGALEHLYSTISDKRLLLGHFWSLCIEEQFYLAWPLVVFLIKDRINLRNICLAICILCLALRILCVFTVSSKYLDAELLYRLTPLRADALLLGGFIALALRGPESASLRRLARPAFYAIILGFVLFQFAYRYQFHHTWSPGVSNPVVSTVGFTIIDIFASAVVLLAIEPGEWLYSVLSLRPLRRLGQISYGFYVFHDIPHGFYIRLVDRLPLVTHHRNAGIALLAFICTITLSHLSFRYYETHFLRLKRFFV